MSEKEIEESAIEYVTRYFQLTGKNPTALEIFQFAFEMGQQVERNAHYCRVMGAAASARMDKVAIDALQGNSDDE